MTNVWLKNKALAWVLVFVFLFTSVFNTGTAFASDSDHVDFLSYVEGVQVQDAETGAVAAVDFSCTDNGEDRIVSLADIPSEFFGDMLWVKIDCSDGANVLDVDDGPGGIAEWMTMNYDGDRYWIRFYIETPDGDLGMCTVEGYNRGASDPNGGSTDPDGDASDPDGDWESTDPNASSSANGDSADLKYMYIWNSRYSRVDIHMENISEDGVVDVEIPSDYCDYRSTLDVRTMGWAEIYSEAGYYKDRRSYEFELGRITAGATKTIKFQVISWDGSAARNYTVNIHATGTPEIDDSDASLRELYVKYKNEGGAGYIKRQLWVEADNACEYLPYGVDMSTAQLMAVMPDNTVKYIPLEFDNENHAEATVVATSRNGVVTREYEVSIYINEPSSEKAFDAKIIATDGRLDTNRWFSSYDYEWEGTDTLTLEVPYGTITDADGNKDNKIRLWLQGYGYSTTADLPLIITEEGEYYEEELIPDQNGRISKTFTITAQDGSQQAFTVIVTESEYGFEEILEKIWVYAEGGKFANGSDCKSASSSLEVNNLEVPVRDGYAFAGWYDKDGCHITDRLWESCSWSVHAKWIKASELEDVYGQVSYNYVYDGWLNNSTEEIYWDSSTHQTVVLPSGTDTDLVKARVKNAANGSSIEKNIKFVDGKASFSHVVKSADGKQTIEVTADIVVASREENVDRLEYIEVIYSGQNGKRWDYIEFNKDGNAVVEIPYSYHDDEPIVLMGWMKDGTELVEHVETSDFDENGEAIAVFTLPNGKTQTVTVKIIPPSSSTNCYFEVATFDGYGEEWRYFDENDFDKNGVIQVVVPDGFISDAVEGDDKQITVYANPFDGATTDMPVCEDDGYWSGYKLTWSPAEAAEKTVTVTAEDGVTTKEYTFRFVEKSESGSGEVGGDSNVVDFYYMTLGWGMNNSFGDGVEVDIEEARTEEGTTIVFDNMPYYGNNYCFEYLEGYSEVGSYITWDGPVYMDETGKVTIVATGHSADGTATETYTIHCVLDEEVRGFEYLNIRYLVGDISKQKTVEFDADNYAEVMIPYSYDAEYGIYYDGSEYSGKWFDGWVYLEDGVGYLEYTDFYGEEYTIKFIQDVKDSNTDCRFWLDIYHEGSGTRTVEIDSETAAAAATENGATVTVPYGTISNWNRYNDSVNIQLCGQPESPTTEIDLLWQEYDWDEENGDIYYWHSNLSPKYGKLSKTVTVTAEDGTVQEYKFNFVEDEGSSTELQYLEVYGDYSYNEIDLDAAATENGADILMAYGTPVDSYLEVWAKAVDFADVDYSERVQLVDGKATIEVKVTSANGKATQIYKINVSTDTVGTDTAISDIEIGNYSEMLPIDIDMNNMTADNKITVHMPTKYFAAGTEGMEYFVSVDEPVGAFTEYTWTSESGREYTYEGWAPIELWNRDSTDVKVTVYSANRENKEEYTITIKKDDSIVPCLNHTYGEWSVATPATCTDMGVQTHTCAVCYRSESAPIPATGHTPGAAATCTTAQTCTVCKAELAAAKGHTPGAAATCTTAQTCTVCKAEVAPALGHDLKDVAAVTATCTTAGHEAGKDCSRCDYTEGLKVVGATGHTPGAAATCTTAQYCTVCNAQVESAKGHTSVVVNEVKSTCTKAGTTAGTKCSVCNVVLTGVKPMKLAAHTYGTYKTTKKATFGKAGVQTATCTVCKKTTKTKSIAAVKTPTLSTASYTFNNKTKKPTVKVAGISSKLYTVTYAKGRKNVGQYSVKVTFKTNADYTGSKTVYFKINPAKPTSVKLTKPGKKQIKVSWKKPSKTYRNQIDGYQIRYATSKSGLEKAKPVKVSGKTATGKTIKKLKAKKKYYVQVRTYNKVGKTTYYSGWTTAKSTKTK